MKLRLLLLMILSLLAGGCMGEETERSEDAEKMFEALFEGDSETAKEFVCTEMQEDVAIASLALQLSEEDTTLSNLSCRQHGEEVRCKYKISGEDYEDKIKIVNDQLCDLEVFHMDLE